MSKPNDGGPAYPAEGFSREKDIRGPGKLFPCGRTKFWELIEQGVLPRPIKVGNMSWFRNSDVLAAARLLAARDGEQS